MNVTQIKTQSQLKEVPTDELLKTYRKLTGRSTKRFATRAKGIAATFAAIQKARESGKLTRSSAKKGDSTPRGLTFRFAPKPEIKEPRPGSRRAELVALCQRANGVKFSEVVASMNGEDIDEQRKNAYEHLRHIFWTSGYGMWSDAVGDDDYRIRIVDAAEYKKLAKAAA